MSFTKSIIEIELARKESRTLKALVTNASSEKEKVELEKAYNRSLGRSYRALEDAEIAKSELEEARDNLLEELLEAKGAELDEIEKELDAVIAYIEDLDNAINEKSKALGDISVNLAIALIAAETGGGKLTYAVASALVSSATFDKVLYEKATKEGLLSIFERANFRGNTLDIALKFRDIINRA
jgi:Rad3-related DNA helicase